MADGDGGRRKKVTIRSVADDAGVSVAAVSKVLRNAYGVSDSLRARVLSSIDKLDYRPSTAARGMRGRTYTIGVLLVELDNPFLPRVVEGIKPALGEASCQFMIGVGQAEERIEQSLIDSMADMRMDGVILVAPRLHGDLLARHARRLPTVVIGHHQPSATSFDTVNSDDQTGARLAVEALLAAGRREIHMLSLQHVSPEFSVFAERERGYLDAMAAAGLADRARVRRYRERPDRPGTPIETFFDDGPLPEAVVCWSDIHAIQILNAAWQRGVEVPGRLAVVGYDNTPVAGLPMIGLTSVEQRGPDIGRLAAQTLLSRIGGRETPEHLLVTPELARRSSA